MKMLPLFLIPILSLAAQSPSPAVDDKTPPSYDLKPQALEDLKDIQQKFAALAQAIPQEKFTWRPSDDVRSVSEVFLHVARANFNFASDIGKPPALDFKPDSLEKSTTDKAKIIARINQSFDYLRSAIEKQTNKELETIVPKFGPTASEGDLAFVATTHAHEHLGQLIAYARMIGVVPPWTAAAQKSSQKSSQK